MTLEHGINIQYRRTMQYLQSLDIDPTRVLITDFTIEGFWMIAKGPDGERIKDGNGDIMTEFMAWKDPEAALHAMDLFLKDKFGVA